MGVPHKAEARRLETPETRNPRGSKYRTVRFGVPKSIQILKIEPHEPHNLFGPLGNPYLSLAAQKQAPLSPICARAFTAATLVLESWFLRSARLTIGVCRRVLVTSNSNSNHTNRNNGKENGSYYNGLYIECPIKQAQPS